jgi:hypothetical protein
MELGEDDREAGEGERGVGEGAGWWREEEGGWRGRELETREVLTWNGNLVGERGGWAIVFAGANCCAIC